MAEWVARPLGNGLWETWVIRQGAGPFVEEPGGVSCSFDQPVEPELALDHLPWPGVSCFGKVDRGQGISGAERHLQWEKG